MYVGFNLNVNIDWIRTKNISFANRKKNELNCKKVHVPTGKERKEGKSEKEKRRKKYKMYFNRT